MWPHNKLLAGLVGALRNKLISILDKFSAEFGGGLKLEGGLLLRRFQAIMEEDDRGTGDTSDKHVCY